MAWENHKWVGPISPEEKAHELLKRLISGDPTANYHPYAYVETTVDGVRYAILQDAVYASHPDIANSVFICIYANAEVPSMDAVATIYLWLRYNPEVVWRIGNTQVRFRHAFIRHHRFAREAKRPLPTRCMAIPERIRRIPLVRQFLKVVHMIQQHERKSTTCPRRKLTQRS